MHGEVEPVGLSEGGQKEPSLVRTMPTRAADVFRIMLPERADADSKYRTGSKLDDI